MRAILLPTGPYLIGFTKFDLLDEQRPDLSYPKGRPIPIQVYFPFGKGRHTPHFKILDERVPQKFPPLECMGYSRSSQPFELIKSSHPLIFLNHGNYVAMTDYAFLAEDLASHGYVVISIQHQLKDDKELPESSRDRSYSKHAKIIDNLFCVFEWVKLHGNEVFCKRININKVGLIGHSMGVIRY